MSERASEHITETPSAPPGSDAPATIALGVQYGEETFEVKVRHGTLIQQLRGLIGDRVDMPPHSLTILFSGKILENNRTVGDYHLQKGVTVQVIQRDTAAVVPAPIYDDPEFPPLYDLPASPWQQQPTPVKCVWITWVLVITAGFALLLVALSAADRGVMNFQYFNGTKIDFGYVKYETTFAGVVVESHRLDFQRAALQRAGNYLCFSLVFGVVLLLAAGFLVTKLLRQQRPGINITLHAFVIGFMLFSGFRVFLIIGDRIFRGVVRDFVADQGPDNPLNGAALVALLCVYALFGVASTGCCVGVCCCRAKNIYDVQSG